MEDYWQYIMYRIVKESLLTKYDPSLASFDTYISLIVHSSISRYKRSKYNDDMYVNGEKRINKGIDVATLDSHSTVDIDEIEARYDIFKFFSWYKVKRDLRQWKTSTDVKILKLLLLGYNPTEIATQLKITVQAVSQSRIKMYRLYKHWLKLISLKNGS